MTETVIVVTHDASGQLLKVCSSWQAFDNWAESSEWELYDMDTWEAHVYDEEGGNDTTPQIAYRKS